MKKLIALFLSLILVMLMVPAFADDPITVTVWTREVDSEDPTAPSQRYIALAEKWNETHDDIKIDMVVGSGIDTMTTAISTGSTPDVIDVLWQSAAPLAARGAILELTDYVNNDADWDKDDIIPAGWNVASVDGHVYSILRSVNSAYLMYSPKYLADHGYDAPPATVEEITEYAKALTEFNDDGSVAVYGLNPISPWQDDVLWPVAYGADWIDEDGNVTFDTEEIRGAYGFQRELIEFYGDYETASDWNSTNFATLATENDPVFTGKVAMRFIFDWDFANLAVAAENAGMVYGEDYAITSFPYGMMTCAVFQVNAKTEHPDETWQVLSYLTNKESQAYLAEGRGNNGEFMPRISANESLVNGDYTDVVKVAATALMGGQLKNFPNSMYVTEYLNAIGSHMNEYLRGYIDLDEAVQLVQEEAEAAKAELE